MNKAGRRTGKEPSFFPVHLLFFTRDAGPASVIRCCRADFINKNGKNCASGMITLYYIWTVKINIIYISTKQKG